MGIFLALNFSFMWVELVYGWWTNSLGLISDGFHMLFDCTGLLLSLIASWVANWPSDPSHTFGFARYEELAGFTNALFLIFIAMSIVLESVERLYDPPHIEHQSRLLLISVLGFMVNMVVYISFTNSMHIRGIQRVRTHTAMVRVGVAAVLTTFGGCFCISLRMHWAAWR